MNNSNELHLAIDDGFIGSPYSPRVDITETDSGHEISITSKKPEGIVEDTLDIPDADWQRAEDAREAAESSRVRAENSRKAEWDVISADATSATSAANDAADSANQAASAANAAAESAADAEADLRAAAARGDFDGFSPVVDIDDGASSHTITITDREGDHSYTVPTYAAEESARAAAETSRVSAESNRVSAESLRVSAEGLRASAENARASAESSRASAESSRRSAENSRVIAETSRANAESSRVTAEAARAQAEIARDEAEDLRDSDEQARVSAESARATEWAEIESDAQGAIDAAQDAADDATAAAAEARAASAATWLSGNVLFGELAEAAVLTTDDAYAAPPKGVEVYGKSTQSGTPTPDAPVPIKSVDDLTLHVCGKNLFGGTALRDAALAGYSLNATGTDSIGGDYVTVRAQNYGLFSMPFKANTRYTLVMKFSKSDTNANVNIEFRYIDGTTTSVQKQGMAASTLYTIAVTSTANKTVKEIRAWNASGITYCYYEGCGLFEGVLTADQFEPYVGASVSIPLSDHPLRSLPDGTRDELDLTYLRPSTRAGWAWYSETLVQRVDTLTLDGTQPLALAGWRASETSIGFAYAASTLPITTNALLSSMLRASLYDDLYYSRVDSGMTHGTAPAYSLFVRVPYPELTTVALTSAWLAENPITIQYALATPITHDLGTVELPILSNPLTAWADGGSAQPTLAMSYEQDINIVIARLKDAIADMATS